MLLSYYCNPYVVFKLHWCCSGLGSMCYAACAMVRLRLGVMVLVGSHFLDLPPDMQRLILGWISLRQMAQLACLSAELRSMYLERVKKRDAAVASLLESHFTADFREGLSPSQTALPRDLIVDPPVRRPCFVSYAKVSSVDTIWMHDRMAGSLLESNVSCDVHWTCLWDSLLGERKGFWFGITTQQGIKKKERWVVSHISECR
jgi:hypothetical protein